VSGVPNEACNDLHNIAWRPLNGEGPASETADQGANGGSGAIPNLEVHAIWVQLAKILADHVYLLKGVISCLGKLTPDPAVAAKFVETFVIQDRDLSKIAPFAKQGKIAFLLVRTAKRTQQCVSE
jgi:hypothetical protein